MNKVVTMENLLEIIDGVFVSSAKETYEKDKVVPPIFIMLRDDKDDPIVCMVPPEMMNAKDLLASLLKQVVEDNKEHLMAVMFVCEAWALELAPDKVNPKEIPTNLANHPDRKEVIIFTLETTKWIKTKRIYISDGKILDEKNWDEMTEGQGRFLSFGLCKDFKESDKPPEGFKFVDGAAPIKKNKENEGKNKNDNDKFNHSYA
jgi:hypothetical protein